MPRICRLRSAMRLAEVRYAAPSGQLGRRPERTRVTNRGPTRVPPIRG